MDGKNVIPAGAKPPESQDKVEPTNAKQEPILGKFNSVDELADSYTALEKKFGEQGSQVGELKGQTKLLMEQNQSLMESFNKKGEQVKQEPAEPPIDFEGELKTIAKQYEDGDLSFEQAMLASNAITARQTEGRVKAEATEMLKQAKSTFQEELENRDSQNVVSDFHKDNPDFKQFKDSGEIQKVMELDPMADELSAFWRLKADKAYEAGKLEAARLAEGSEQTGKVLSDPGTSMQTNTKPKPTGEKDRKASMMAAIT